MISLGSLIWSHRSRHRIVNLLDVRKGLSELREGLKTIRKELHEFHGEPETNDRYSRQMWDFLRKGSAQLEDLEDIVNLADNTFTEVVKYFGEDDRNMSSTEFYGIFKTFLTSYRVRPFRDTVTTRVY